MINKNTIWIKAITPPYGKTNYDGQVIDTGKDGEKIFTLPEKFALARLRVFGDMFQRVTLPDEVMELIDANKSLRKEIKALKKRLEPKPKSESAPDTEPESKPDSEPAESASEPESTSDTESEPVAEPEPEPKLKRKRGRPAKKSKKKNK